MPLLKEIANCFEAMAPLSHQESYDNSGIQLGEPDKQIDSALVTLDLNEQVAEEAIRLGVDLIVTHHPLIFKPLKQISGATPTERMVIGCLRHDIAVYACHTNLDASPQGVSHYLARKLGITNGTLLEPRQGLFTKLVVYIPAHAFPKVREALFQAGAGTMGDYEQCGFSAHGLGSFLPGKETHPYVGTPEQFHEEPEVRFETLFPSRLKKRVVEALMASHPYEEPAFDLFPLLNASNDAGFGWVGNLPEPLSAGHFLEKLKEKLACGALRYSTPPSRPIQKVAICGGSGSDLLGLAIAAGADAFVTADLKYHAFQAAEGALLLVDAGHYETEQFTKELFYDVLTKKFNNFAVHISKVKTNPINYL